VETLRKDTSTLTDEQKLEIIVAESPELIQLLEEFKENIGEVKEKLQPVLQKIKAGELPTSNGVSYLEVKHRIYYLTYNLNGRKLTQ
jgi:hypothetical protein